MDYYELAAKNLRAIDLVRFGNRPDNITDCNLEIGYRGFVNCVAAEGSDPFVMFTNADDFVAGSYFYNGPASFETGTLRLWDHLVRKSTWIYDVGAYTGAFALAAAAANPSCYVMAFEPSFITYSRLLVNISANRFDDRIAPLRYGLGDAVNELELRHPSGVYVMASGESFVDSHIADPWFVEKVPVTTLEELVGNQSRYRKQIVVSTEFSGVDLLKIDVEGFEANVLKGMQGIIREHRPTAIVEILEPSGVASILELFGSGYQVRHINEETGSLSDVPVGTNKLFIHEDHAALLDGYSSL
ncbi:FkbM family methyltransferase [Sphingomonas sp. BN140010]|uniref:FkbM family methyltransferase n=1 Tax=Sphingomonas arvum TaxID=2992113 RepID=A0ABT3JC74_9SPHN|nr:FkbM family methyltransferase [Sphingomonas sp. BN140010]MCW3796670.1 FkbM family methyltransferase [Sphingomonas sp. BN140010]